MTECVVCSEPATHEEMVFSVDDPRRYKCADHRLHCSHGGHHRWALHKPCGCAGDEPGSVWACAKCGCPHFFFLGVVVTATSFGPR